MSDVALAMEHVYKKFRKGEIYNSLRDLVPALTGKLFQQQDLSTTDKREFWALQDISFEVRRGEAFGIIGHNGAGKSTALKILSRIMKPSKGRMVTHGRLSALIEVAAGFHWDLTGRENIFLHGTILGMKKREIQSKLDQIIAFSGIEEFIDTPVKRYSSGMYARLGFAVAAHVDPEILVVDEVLSVGDFAFQRRCMERMKEIVRNGTCVLFVSHNLKAVAEFCSRTMLLDRGKIVSIGQAQEEISAYLTRARSTRDANTSTMPVVITKVAIRNEHGESARFRSGEKAWADVEITARERCKKLSVRVWFDDEDFVEVFAAATDRLGVEAFSLEAGESYACTFELQLNMVSGLYHFGLLIQRNDIQEKYDRWVTAATIYVGSEEDVRGSVNCFPRITRQEILPATYATVANVER
jgi:lipopolysaccharide transport system ATP-binding protein